MSRTSAEKEAIIASFNSGRSANQVAREFDTTRSAVLGIVHRARKAGQKAREGRVDDRAMDDKHLEGLRLRCAGYSWAEVKHAVGVGFRSTFDDIVLEDIQYDPTAAAYWRAKC